MLLPVFGVALLSLVACSDSKESNSERNGLDGGATAGEETPNSGPGGNSDDDESGGNSDDDESGGSSDDDESGGNSGGEVGSGSPPDDQPANTECELLWESGFETGFPSDEWERYDEGWSESGEMPDGRVSAWTIVDRASGEPVRSGDFAYRGWVVDEADENHRAYPTVSLESAGFETPLINTFWVYQELDYDALSDSDWVHFGTWGNCVQEGGSCATGDWALHTMAISSRRLEFAHTDPFSGAYIGPEPAQDFPLDRWVKFTVYLDYRGSTGSVVVWQDGAPVLEAEVAKLGDFPGTALSFMHWGMYASPAVRSGTQYNDDIKIWALPQPLTDFELEPTCE